MKTERSVTSEDRALGELRRALSRLSSDLRNTQKIQEAGVSSLALVMSGGGACAWSVNNREELIRTDHSKMGKEVIARGVQSFRIMVVPHGNRFLVKFHISTARDGRVSGQSSVMVSADAPGGM
ncbi:MAG: hypothetical protein PHQ23_14295 [Candidatus Wallbacteria bacterium]|nr:hypothetical protein [Candidatus Wallbacteria bacterium]